MKRAGGCPKKKNVKEIPNRPAGPVRKRKRGLQMWISLRLGNSGRQYCRLLASKGEQIPFHLLSWQE
jgi:hypothetical protein